MIDLDKLVATLNKSCRGHAANISREWTKELLLGSRQGCNSSDYTCRNCRDTLDDILCQQISEIDGRGMYKYNAACDECKAKCRYYIKGGYDIFVPENCMIKHRIYTFSNYCDHCHIKAAILKLENQLKDPTTDNIVKSLRDCVSMFELFLNKIKPGEDFNLEGIR